MVLILLFVLFSIPAPAPAVSSIAPLGFSFRLWRDPSQFFENVFNLLSSDPGFTHA